MAVTLEFTESQYFGCGELDFSLVRAFEAKKRLTLPKSYVELLRIRNGGSPRLPFYHTPFSTSWDDAGFEIKAIQGIGCEWGIDSVSLGSDAMIAEWGYPEIGIVVCVMPSGGHDAVMLDYRSQGEPSVVYVDEDREPRRVALNFEEFVAGLCAPPETV